MAIDPEPCTFRMGNRSTSAGNPVDEARPQPSQKWCSIFSVPVTQSEDEDAKIKDENENVKAEKDEDEYEDEHGESENPLPTQKKRARRGRKRKHAGSSERRWQKLESAQQWQ